jgi:hypothetical protein
MDQRFSPAFAEAVSESSQAIRFHLQPVDSKGLTATKNPLNSSFTALSRLRSVASDGDWIDSARVLKSDAVRVRDTAYSRHSSVLLALADALVYTSRSELSKGIVGPTFDRALALLSEPFIRESDEEALLGDLIAHGWNLVPAADDDD